MSPIYWEPEKPEPNKAQRVAEFWRDDPRVGMLAHSRRMDRVKSWVVVILMGAGIGLVVGLLVSGCDNPAVPSTPHIAVHPIPRVVPN